MGIPYLLLTLALLPQLGGESNTLHKLEALQLAPNLGKELAPFVDWDGDGVEDFLVGAEGMVLLVSGSDGQTLRIMEPGLARPSFGNAIQQVGDLDGDGMEDILIGAPGANIPGIDRAGVAYLFSGATGQQLRRWDGISLNGKFGNTLSPLPDVDGDGVQDLAIGAPHTGAQERGKVFFYSGASGVLLHVLTGEAWDTFGAGLLLGDDYDLDGIPDLLIGSPSYDAPGGGDGGIFVYSCADARLIRIIVGPSSGSGGAAASFGTQLSLLDDIDGDGRKEILLATPDGDWAGWFQQGIVRAYSGVTGDLLLNVGGLYDHHLFGSSVAPVDDLDLDGKGDFIALAGNSLDAYLYSGTGVLIETFSIGGSFLQRVATIGDLDGDGLRDLVFSNQDFNQVVTVSSADRTELYRLERRSSYAFGGHVAPVGDIDSDGVMDVGVGDPDGGTLPSQGAVSLYSGQDGSILHYLEGAAGDSQAGNAILAAGDLDGDGTVDFLVGSPGHQSGAGLVAAHSGVDGRALYSHMGPAGGRFGQSLTSMGDLDGDGILDFAAGAPGLDQVQVHSGADGNLLWLVAGPHVGESFGSSIASLDADQDGILDLLIGAPLSEPWTSIWRSGSVYLHAGADGSLLLHKKGPRNRDAHLGLAVAAAGDVDQDGMEDFMAGAPGDSDGFLTQGSVTVWSGADGSPLHRIYGETQDMYIGNALCSANDVDRDGHADLLLGSDAQGFLLYSGATGKLLHANREGTLQHRLGRSVAPLGDLDGNGSPDFVVGAPYQGGHGIPGTAWVYDFAPFLSTDSYAISLVSGGQLNLTLDFPAAQAQREYRVLVSTTGVGPTLFGVEIPLTADAVARDSFLGIYPFPGHTGLQGNLDSQGDATGSLSMPTGLPPGFLGFRFWIAAIALTPGQVPEASSVAIPFVIGP